MFCKAQLVALKRNKSARFFLSAFLVVTGLGSFAVARADGPVFAQIAQVSDASARLSNDVYSSCTRTVTFGPASGIPSGVKRCDEIVRPVARALSTAGLLFSFSAQQFASRKLNTGGSRTPSALAGNWQQAAEVLSLSAAERDVGDRLRAFIDGSSKDRKALRDMAAMVAIFDRALLELYVKRYLDAELDAVSEYYDRAIGNVSRALETTPDAKLDAPIPCPIGTRPPNKFCGPRVGLAQPTASSLSLRCAARTRIPMTKFTWFLASGPPSVRPPRLSSPNVR